VTLAVGTPADRGSVTGPGLRDLAGAWLSAGARAVLLALWDPPAESGPRLLAEFHRAVASGAPPAVALEGARRAVARDPRLRDPVHWAGFVLYGAP
jgi:CHAT domain-containing protein